MISRAQQILIKRAQREAGLSDPEYRDALEAATGCRSSTDPKITDRGVDLVLAYFEAIYFRGIDAGQLQPSGKPAAVFKHRGYWAAKNPKEQTSRDRYASRTAGGTIEQLEQELSTLGFGSGYCAAIRSKVTHGRGGPHALYLYQAALTRTLRAKRSTADRKSAGSVGERPF